MKRISILVLLVLITSISQLLFSQNDMSEKGLLTLNQKKEFIAKEKDLTKIESFLSEIGSQNLDSAAYYYKQYLDRGLVEDNKKIQLISYYYLGDISYEKGNFLKSIEYGKKLLQIAQKESNIPYEIIGLNQLGNIYYKIRDYDTSLKYYLEAYTIAKTREGKDLELQLLTNISNLRTRIHRYEEALQSYQKILNLLRQEKYKNVLNYKGVLLSAILGSGVCRYKLGQYDEAIQTYEKGLQLAKKHEINQYIVIFHLTMGEVYTAKESFDLALSHLYEAKDLIHSFPEKQLDPNLHTANFHLATVFYKKNNNQKSLDYLSESFEIINKVNNEKQVEKISEMYDLAYNNAKRLNNKELQITYGEAYRRVIDSLHMDDISAKDQLYDQDINELEEKNEDLLLWNVRYIVISMISVVLVLWLLFFNYNRQKRNKKLFKELEQKLQNEGLKEMASKIKKEFVTDKKAEMLLKKLEDLKKTGFYLEEDCNRYNTAKLIDTNTTYLSKIINEHQQKSFNDYINELRISHCLDQLASSKKFRSYTIKAIASELGYKSVNTFASAFKKQTGISHSYYIKQILKKEKVVNEKPEV